MHPCIVLGEWSTGWLRVAQLSSNFKRAAQENGAQYAEKYGIPGGGQVSMKVLAVKAKDARPWKPDARVPLSNFKMPQLHLNQLIYDIGKSTCLLVVTWYVESPVCFVDRGPLKVAANNEGTCPFRIWYVESQSFEQKKDRRRRCQPQTTQNSPRQIPPRLWT